jgi:dTMP kinase
MTGRGAFIVLEGLDCAGKTTQAERLEQTLDDHDIPNRGLRFPDRGTPTGKVLDAYLSCGAPVESHVINLLFCANRWEKDEEIREHLAEGTTIICDRYAYSGVAYSAAMGLDRAWCKAPNVGLPEPDLVIFLDIPADLAAKRKGFGRERFEKVELQQKILEEFNRLKEPSWRILDASQSADELAKQIRDLALAKIDELATGDHPVKNLWTRV